MCTSNKIVLMPVRLNDIDLALASTNNGQPYEEDLRTILSISTKDRRIIIEHTILGSSGNILQDMGTEPVQITLEGEMHGSEASKTIRRLHEIYEKGEPVKLNSDLASISEVSRVKIENFQVNNPVGLKYHYVYTLDLKEDRD
jgi:hypothetical protein